MTNSKPLNYHKLNAELEAILDSLQSGELDIEKAIKHYERGMKIVGQLQDYFKTAENKVTKIKKDFAN